MLVSIIGKCPKLIFGAASIVQYAQLHLEQWFPNVKLHLDVFMV